MEPYPSYQDSGSIWLGEIPSHWTLTRAKFIFSKMDRPIRDEDDVITAFRDGIVTLRTNRRTEGFTISLKEIGYQGIRKGDLVIHEMDGFAGAIGVSDSDGKATPVYTVCTPRNDASTQYYAYLLRTMARNGFIQSLAKGIRERSTSFSFNILQDLELPYFPLPEQQAIADFLDRKTAQIDTLIAKKQRQIELLHEQRTALINHAVTKGLNPNAPMKDSGVEWLGEIPRGWEVVKLKYIGSAFIGLTYNPENVTDEENGTLVFRASNVQDGKIVFDDNVYVKMEIPERLITKVGDILICVRSGSRDLIGKNALIDEKSAGHAFGAFMTVFRSDINYFLSYVFKSQLFKVQSGIFNTSTVNQLTQGNLYDFQVAIPPVDEQEEIIQFLNKELAQIDETVNRISTQIVLLQEYRTALISAVVTGKVDVREWKTLHE